MTPPLRASRPHADSRQRSSPGSGCAADAANVASVVLEVSHGDGSYARLMNQLLKTDLLILDDWGMQKVTAQQRQDLMEVIEDRHGRGSTLIASQLPTEHWHDYIDSATLADAILDRLLHGAHRLNLKGESLRKAKAQNTESVDPS